VGKAGALWKFSEVHSDLDAFVSALLGVSMDRVGEVS
jgi:hypothetical protein